MHSGYGFDFVDSPSGLLVPVVSDVTRTLPDGETGAFREVSFDLDLPGGTSDFLRADGAWASPGGGASAWTLIGSVVRSTDGAIDTDPIDVSGYRQLKIIGSLRASSGGVSVAELHARMNNDSGNSYFGQVFGVTGTTLSGLTFGPAASARMGVAAGSTAGATEFTPFEMLLTDYAQATRRKWYLCSSGTAGIGSTTLFQTRQASGLWNNANAITRVAILRDGGNNSWSAGSRIDIYGIS